MRKIRRRKTIRGGLGPNATTAIVNAANSAMLNASSAPSVNISSLVKVSPEGEIKVQGTTPTLSQLFTLFKDQPEVFFKHIENFPVNLDTAFIMLIDSDKRSQLMGPAQKAVNIGTGFINKAKRGAAIFLMRTEAAADKIINGIKPIAQERFNMSDELLARWKAAYMKTDKGKIFEAGQKLAEQFLNEMKNISNM